MRVGEKYPSYTLWGPSGVTPTDIAQGEIGNCWIIASLSAMAEYPERIHNIFYNTEVSRTGMYGMRIYALGVPYTTYVDDYLPFNKTTDGLSYA